MAHDLARFMSYYSDRYLSSGMRKSEMQRVHSEFIGRVTSYEVTVTDFIPAGDRAYFAGFATASWGKGMFSETTLIKENGKWKRYGNQRDALPEEW